MAAKLSAVVFLLVALSAVASASAYTTVVTTVVTEEMNPRGQSCDREMQQKMPMKQCTMWMRKMMRGEHGHGVDAFLRSAVANPRFEEEHLQECCGEIKQFSSGCRCDAVKEMMMEMPQMEQMARSLPTMCGITQCHFRA